MSTHDSDPARGPLKDRAWEWLRLLTSKNATESDVQQFREWVMADPAHQAAYREVKVVWDALKPVAGEVVRAQPDLVAEYVGERRDVIRSRRAFLGMAGACAAVAGVAIVRPPMGLWPSASEWSADLRTATGEQRLLALGDGVDVMLNTRTSMRQDIVAGRTVGLGLLAGEAAVDLKGAQAFTVTAGKGASTAQTGSFEVRHVGDGEVCVTCVTGAVRVAHPAGTRNLVERQQIRYDASNIGSLLNIDPDQMAAWRRGLLVFKEVRLAEVIDEINRYRTGHVVLLNQRAGDRPVSGYFRVAALDQAIAQLQYAFDLQTRSLVGGVLVLS